MRKIERFFLLLITLCLLAGSAADCVPKAAAASDMTVSASCVDFIKQVEGFSPQPYYDYNQYTVGYGTRCPTEKYFEYKSNGIPRKEAEELLHTFLTDISDTIHQKLIEKYQLTLTQQQFDALVSFSFNVGTGWMTYDSSLRNAILSNANDSELVYAFSLYCTAGGKYSPGLITRRLCEANIYLNNIYSNKISDGFGYVFFDPNGGSLTYRVQGFLCDSNCVPAADAVKSGDVFLGWYTSLTGGTQVTVLDRALSGRTLFARWQSSENPDSQTASVTNVKVTGDIVNIRSGPGTNYGRVKQVYRNDALQVSHVSHLTTMQWGKVQDGWICLDYTNYHDVINGTADQNPGTIPEDSGSVTVPEEENNPVPVPDNQNTVSGIVKVNDALRIRSGPGTNHAVVGFLFNGKEVDILEQETVDSMVWGRISNGWVSMDYVEISRIFDDPIIAPGGNQNGVQQPAPEPEPLPEPEPVPEPEPETQPVPDQQPEQENPGPIDTTEPAAVKGIVTADALRIRSGASTEYRIVGFYYQDDVVAISEKTLVDSVYWGKTDKGWINMDYISELSSSTESSQPTAGERMTVIGDCLRVRKEAGTNYRISALLYYGDTVIVYETKTVDGTVWGRVDKGWICMDYVS